MTAFRLVQHGENSVRRYQLCLLSRMSPLPATDAQVASNIGGYRTISSMGANSTTITAERREYSGTLFHERKGRDRADGPASQ